MSISSKALEQRAKDKPKQLVNEAQAQPIIAAASNNFSTDFFCDNRSILPLEEVQARFIDLFPHDFVLCGYEDNRDMRPREQAVSMMKIDLRAKPHGPNMEYDESGKRRGGWNLTYDPLPMWMGFDVDENKSLDFKRLFPDYRCYEIHDALDIRRPQVITINPRSGNCQYLYEMLWTDEDMDRPEATMVEYQRLRKELSMLLAADTRFVNHVVRSPMYVAGHQRKNPGRISKGNKRVIDLDKRPLWHHSIWYEPHGYTLAELRELVGELRELHEMLANDVPGAVMVAVPTTSQEPQHKSNGYSIPYARQQEMARRSASTVQVGERNDWLFSCLAVNHGRPNVNRFRSGRDYIGFTNFLSPIATRLNSELHDPLDEGEVERTSQSIIKFLLSGRFNRHRTSDYEEATFINRPFRWGVDYVSKIQQLADEQGIGYEAAKKRIQRNSSSSFLHDRDGDIISHTSKSWNLPT
jgi:hypothetical protein